MMLTPSRSPLFWALALAFAAGVAYAGLSVAPAASVLFGAAFIILGAFFMYMALRMLVP
jgi:hypothetical protein